ncbi:MAG TPA: DUF6401 family natural product biosynthesis protein [Amycolatopsis sp.]|uniref:DUF6401 family natural product biosynthesis protein n=1 Tax=Amycolatopsis sp. TaxID=37632 RepID=UPI002B46F5A9|nr:DUF6401 family natural product biosynthesis protein [Amycolatopsis sp.]HKS43606.1 DUF6401 family natural product biosynthesis protein [Amycolatopsis sp.]
MHWADFLAERSARRWLRGMAGQLEPGWHALAWDPALWPVFERHLSAVHDAVRVEDEMVERAEPVSDLILIAGHAHDVWTEAVSSGWRAPEQPAGWTAKEWSGLRLLACYRLAAAEPHGPRLPQAAEGLRPALPDLRRHVR